MKAALLILSFFITQIAISQSNQIYKYKLKLKNTPSKFTVTTDSINPEKSLVVFVSDYNNYPLSFATVRIIADGFDKTFQTDAEGYLSKPIALNNCRLVIASTSHNEIDIGPLLISDSSSTIVRAKLTLRMSSKPCSIVSSKKLSSLEINKIAIEFSEDPFNPKLVNNKFYSVMCQL